MNSNGGLGFATDLVLVKCPHCKKDTPMKWQWQGEVICAQCRKSFWDTTADDWEVRRVVKRYLNNRRGLHQCFVVLTLIAAAWVPTCTYLGAERNVIFWFVALSATTLGLVTIVKRTFGSNNLLTGRLEYLQVLMGSLLLSSILFAAMQLYRQYIVERVDQVSTITEIEETINRLRSLLFIEKWPAAVGYASVAIAGLILLGLIPSSVLEWLPKKLKVAGKTAARTASAFAALGLFIFVGTASQGSILASQVVLRAKVKDLERRFDTQMTKVRHLVEEAVAVEVADHLASVLVDVLSKSSDLVEVRAQQDPPSQWPLDLGNGDDPPPHGPGRPPAPVHGSRDSGDSPRYWNGTNVVHQAAIGTLVGGGQLARYRQAVWKDAVSQLSPKGLGTAVGLPSSRSSPNRDTIAVDGRIDAPSHTSASGLGLAEKVTQSAKIKHAEPPGADFAIREVIGIVVKGSFEGLPKPISKNLSEYFGDASNAATITKVMESLLDDVVLGTAKDLVKELLVAAAKDFRTILRRNEFAQDKVKEAVIEAFSQPSVANYLHQKLSSALSAITKVRAAFVQGEWSSHLFETISKMYFNDKVRQAESAVCMPAEVKKAVDDLESEVALAAPGQLDTKRASLLDTISGLPNCSRNINGETKRDAPAVAGPLPTQEKRDPIVTNEKNTAIDDDSAIPRSLIKQYQEEIRSEQHRLERDSLIVCTCVNSRTGRVVREWKAKRSECREYTPC